MSKKRMIGERGTGPIWRKEKGRRGHALTPGHREARTWFMVWSNEWFKDFDLGLLVFIM